MTDKKEAQLEKERSDYSERFAVIDESGGAQPLVKIFNAEQDAEDYVDKMIEERGNSGEFVADKYFLVKLPKPLRQKLVKEQEKKLEQDRKEATKEASK